LFLGYNNLYIVDSCGRSSAWLERRPVTDKAKVEKTLGKIVVIFAIGNFISLCL
jgi:hypothetical protein